MVPWHTSKAHKITFLLRASYFVKLKFGKKHRQQHMLQRCVAFWFFALLRSSPNAVLAAGLLHDCIPSTYTRLFRTFDCYIGGSVLALCQHFRCGKLASAQWMWVPGTSIEGIRVGMRLCTRSGCNATSAGRQANLRSGLFRLAAAPILIASSQLLSDGKSTLPSSAGNLKPRRGDCASVTLRRVKIPTWLILPVVICLSQRLSHACLSISLYTAKLRMAH